MDKNATSFGQKCDVIFHKSEEEQPARIYVLSPTNESVVLAVGIASLTWPNCPIYILDKSLGDSFISTDSAYDVVSEATNEKTKFLVIGGWVFNPIAWRFGLVPRDYFDKKETSKTAEFIYATCRDGEGAPKSLASIMWALLGQKITARYCGSVRPAADALFNEIAAWFAEFDKAYFAAKPNVQAHLDEREPTFTGLAKVARRTLATILAGKRLAVPTGLNFETDFVDSLASSVLVGAGKPIAFHANPRFFPSTCRLNWVSKTGRCYKDTGVEEYVTNCLFFHELSRLVSLTLKDSVSEVFILGDCFFGPKQAHERLKFYVTAKDLRPLESLIKEPFKRSSNWHWEDSTAIYRISISRVEFAQLIDFKVVGFEKLDICLSPHNTIAEIFTKLNFLPMCVGAHWQRNNEDDLITTDVLVGSYHFGGGGQVFGGLIARPGITPHELAECRKRYARLGFF